MRPRCKRTGRTKDVVQVSHRVCPKSASKVWKVIICGREVLKKGPVKHIGDGQDTRIWHDQWLTGVPSLKPLVWDE